MADEQFTVVFEAQDQVEAQIVRSILEEAGIPVLERPLGSAALSVYIGEGASAQSQLSVPGVDTERARALIEEYRREAVTVEMPAEEEAEAAPAEQPGQRRSSCGQTVVIFLLVLLLIGVGVATSHSQVIELVKSHFHIGSF
ncbi:MAG: putative signal transducing protein [Armatimonadota bacterium]